MTADIIPFPQRPRPLDQHLVDRIDQITLGVQRICIARLDEQVEACCSHLIDEVLAAAPNTFARGRVEIWSSAIVHCVASHNGLFYAWFGPRIAAAELAEIAECSMPSINSRSKQLRELVGIGGSSDVDDQYRVHIADPFSGADTPLESLASLFSGLDDGSARARAELDASIVTLESLAQQIEMFAEADVPVDDALRIELDEHVARMYRASDARNLSMSHANTFRDNALPVLTRAHQFVQREVARTLISPELFEGCGDSIVPLLELALSLFEDELPGASARGDEDRYVSDRRALLAAILTTMALGATWARGSMQPRPGWLHDHLACELSEAVEWLEANEPVPGGVASPLAQLACDAVSNIGVTWNGQLQSAARLPYMLAFDEAHSAVSIALQTDLPAGIKLHDDPDDAIHDAFDTGIAYALVEQVLDERADALHRTRARTANILEWTALVLDAEPDATPQTPSTYRIKVTLRDIEPPIWRTIELPGETRLSDLHLVLQAAMGWMNCHLHQFRIDRTMLEEAREHTLQLRDIAPAVGDAFEYEYDFGDGWEHHIVVEEITRHEHADDPAIGSRPLLVDGQQSCPPEDCGGVPGYAQMLAALADPEDPQHDEFREWIDGGFDPSAFDPSRFDSLLGAMIRR